MPNSLRPIHPGEHLRGELEELDISARAFTQTLHVPTNRITTILNALLFCWGDALTGSWPYDCQASPVCEAFVGGTFADGPAKPELLSAHSLDVPAG